MSNELRLGVEEEFMLIDPDTLELSSESEAFLADADENFGKNVKAEFHASVVETVTDPCSSIAEVREQLRRHRKTVIDLAEKHGLLLAAAGTHPTTHWKDVRITSGARYERILDNLRDIARANLIYGMHCHVEIADPEARIQVMNTARYFLPHILALSCSSPLWQGMPTGHMSTRTHIFKRFPRTGVPDYFSGNGEYERFVSLLVKTNCIDNPKMIYWDIRPHPFYPTLEFRVCDTPTRVEETTAIVALIQAIVHKLLSLYRNNLGYRLYRRALIAENVYRAARYGLEAKFIDFQREEEVPAPAVIAALCEFLEADFAALGTLDEVPRILAMAAAGNSAQRQLKRYEETGCPKEVTRSIIEETKEGL